VDSTDLSDMKAEFADFLQNDLELTITYRALGPTSVKDTDFGIVTTPVNVDTPLYAATVVNPDAKTKSKYGVVEEVDLIAQIATKQLDDLSLVIHRETGAIIHQSVEYEISSITPIPAILGSSVVTVLGCKKRKPLNG